MQPLLYCFGLSAYLLQAVQQFCIAVYLCIFAQLYQAAVWSEEVGVAEVFEVWLGVQSVVFYKLSFGVVHVPIAVQFGDVVCQLPGRVGGRRAMLVGRVLMWYSKNCSCWWGIADCPQTLPAHRPRGCWLQTG